MDERSSTPAGDPPAPPAAAPGSPAAAAFARAAAAPKQPQKEESNIKETIESILVAFILAFIFRAFIVEAFVIPTGSMAPTLLGAHLRFECSDCGYVFETNYGAQNDPDGNPILPARSGRVHQVNCPNCGFRVRRQEAQNLPVHYGDRILVLKYLYLFEDPNRWDVVVFKSPYDAPRYTQNYIKRLVGKPNESVVLLDGDVYVAPSANAREISDFQIQTKPPHVQQALWRIIYDNDYHPRGLSRAGAGWKQPWSVLDGSGWTLDGDGGAGAAERIFAFDNGTSGGTIYFDREANSSNYPFSDWLAYDIEGSWQPQVVGDLKLKLDYTRTAGEGPLRLRLSKGANTFIAELTPTTARLLKREDNGAEAELASAPLRMGRRPLRVEFQNVDYRVALSVNGDELLHTTPEQYRPNTAALLEAFENRETPAFPAVEVSGERQTAQIAHLSLWRDVYYTNRGTRVTSEGYRTNDPFWASPASFPETVMHLGPKEYFVLGDNSQMSLDARSWTDDINLPDLHVTSGRVPERFMLGKAFFVYWPAGYKPIQAERMPAITPNFGDMRFIR